MNIIISGAGGFMGREVAKLADSGYQGAIIIAGVDPAGSSTTFSFPCSDSFTDLESQHGDLVKSADVIVDFSHHSATKELTAFAIRNSLPLVLATTGQTDEEKIVITASAEKIPLFFASNFSIGVTLLIRLAKITASAMQNAEIEIVEVHHNRKIDAPSGTALTLAKAVQEIRPESQIVTGRSGSSKRAPGDIGINSVRIGNVVGIHEVLVGTQNETITLKHEAHSRALFAEGALTAAAFLSGKNAGLYDMQSMIRMDMV